MLNFEWPLPGQYKRLSSKFGWRLCFGKWGFHGAWDIPCGMGTPVCAPYDGVVKEVKTGLRTGLTLTLDHPSCGKVLTKYYHLKSICASVGQQVKTGHIIAISGNTGLWTTGPHLHFEIVINGKQVDPKFTYPVIAHANGLQGISTKQAGDCHV